MKREVHVTFLQITFPSRRKNIVSPLKKRNRLMLFRELNGF